MRLAEGDDAVLCSIISTSEYCRELVGQLGRSVVKQLTDPQLREQVDTSTSEDKFTDVVTDCLSALVLGVETVVDGALTTLTRFNWMAVESVGDQSEWVGVIKRAMTSVASVIGPRLSEVLQGGCGGGEWRGLYCGWWWWVGGGGGWVGEYIVWGDILCGGLFVRC